MRPGLLCAAVALLAALGWGLLVPPFHVTDENAHVAYVQYLAETGELPRPVPGRFSAEQEGVMGQSRFFDVVNAGDVRPPGGAADERALRAFEEQDQSSVGSGSASSATPNPPLFYGLQALAYLTSPSGELLDRIVLMRLLSAFIVAAAVFVVWLFLRELLPGAPWAWTVGALAVALQPLFGHVGAGVSPDGALTLCVALLLLALARAFRRGLTARRAAAIGGALAVALLVKTTALAFVPAVVVAGAVLLWRERSALPWRPALAGVGALAAPLAVFAAVNALLADRPAFGAAEAVAAEGATVAFSTADQLSYLWQLYLPRLGFMGDQFSDFPLDAVWLEGSVGRFGWLDYGFPQWVYAVFVALGLVLLALAVAGAWARRDALRARWAELAVYTLLAAGLALAIGIAGYRYRLQTGLPFEQARYLFPLLPLYAAVIALAARGAGRRWGPAVGAAVVVVAFAHTAFAQLATLDRYYGA